jgi:hypothetical protein
MHYECVPHQRADPGEITTEEAIELFRRRALQRQAEATARQRSTLGLIAHWQIEQRTIISAAQFWLHPAV